MSKHRKHELYKNAWADAMITSIKENGEIKDNSLEKVVFLGIKMMRTVLNAKTEGEADKNLWAFCLVKSMAGRLSLNQFMDIFPIKKIYNGEKDGVKDYYSTLEYIKDSDVNNPIKESFNIDEFFMEYMNEDIHRFVVKEAVTASKLRQFQGGISISEEFFASNGQSTPNTFENHKGKPMYIKKGKPVKIKPIKARKHLSIV